MSSPWHFGNTTVRNPLRIREGLIVLKNTLNGNIIGKSQERLFADELDRAGVIEIANKQRDYSDMGRKWRSCLSQLGFITHKFKRDLRPDEKDPAILEVVAENPEYGLTGRAYEITPSGQRMINAETVQEQQECMLRSLLAYEIPSVIEPTNGEESFNPFIFILQVLQRLGSLENSEGLSKVEMGIVQIYRDHKSVDEVVEKILEFRAERNAVTGRVAKRRVDNALLERIAASVGLQRDSLKDYADVNFRYPRLTGLVSLKGKRLILSDKKLPIINAIISIDRRIIGKENGKEYLTRLWNGSQLPTDNEITAREEIVRFRQLLIDSGMNEALVPTIPETQEVADLNQVRLRLEVLYQQVLEKNYASQQDEEEQVKEIIAYLKKIDKQPIDEETYDIDIEDEPAYLEWAVWRAFLAINQLVNKPHEARRFKVDQDFFPLGCAPGGGPDLIFEFEDYVLVVEVTLTTSSRQEAAEGEPVRRHVAKEKAKVAAASGKPVYGLFLARSIDNNTAETFRVGVWYTGDEPDFINIVPITLKQFILMMEKYVTNRYDNKEFRRVLDTCLIPRNAHAPAWKREIQKVVDSFLG
ncbi:AlwI family type II restriction endonuclease [Brevibacillus laterosporus]|uniref:AlwI family type II restriction endonuclease n=1 Tax=Brevibacillus laterosporus TaxID=1465 RepID=UPI002656F152|nr:AlwI family type II restriction endonuclease [Brevibacillus laterosporus]MDN9010707.1 AlwI family type II restriction endonuclease [Brevibacillus laterosporus]MDO0941730.1 AlwI family type II restriction endonuclease [Brevibacillus laterosporus]